MLLLIDFSYRGTVQTAILKLRLRSENTTEVKSAEIVCLTNDSCHAQFVDERNRSRWHLAEHMGNVYATLQPEVP